MSTFILPPSAQLPFPFAVPVAPRQYTAGVILDSGKLFTVGSFCSYEFALQMASEYVLDLLRIPHPRANRTLRTRDLRAFTDAELAARSKYLRSGWAHKLTRAHVANELARIVQVHRERRIMGGQESDGSDAQDNRGDDIR